VSAGGDDSASATQELVLTIGEEVVDSTAASTGHVARPGLQQIAAFPGPVTDLSVRSDVSASSVTLQWSTPGYDGSLGALQPGTVYEVRSASYTSPDTFALAQAQLAVSTSGAAPGDGVGTGVTGLQPNTTYFFGLWTVDEDGDASTGSVRAAGSTLADPPPTVASPFLDVQATSVTVSWAALPPSPSSRTAEGYTVEASSTDFGSLAPGGVISSSTTYSVLETTLTITDPPLITNQLYYFRVGSRNWQGTLNYATIGSVQTPLQMQDPLPDSPLYTDVSSGSIVAHWQRNGNPVMSLYRLDASLSAGFASYSSSVTYSLAASTTTLSPDTTYYFRVRASSNAGVSGFVSLGSTMTWALPPAAAGTAFSGVAPHQLSLSWLSGGNPGGQSYEVVATTDAFYPNGDAGNVLLTTAPAGTPLTGTPSGLAPNTVYHLYVAALNQLGAPSDYLSAGSTLTPAALPLTAAPAFADVSETALTALWDPDGNPLSITTYTVEASTSPSFDPTATSSVSFSTTPAAASASFTGLAPNTTYYVRARAQDLGGTWSAYATLGSTSTWPIVPQSLRFDQVYPTATSLTLDWSGGANGPGTAYRLNVSSSPLFDADVTTHTTFATQLSTAGLSVNATYFFRVAAIGNDGTRLSAFTSASTATLTNAPSSPLTTAVGLSSASLSWSVAGNPVAITTYTVQASTASDFNGGVYDQVTLSTAPPGTSPSATLSGLSADTTYFLRVAAVNRNGVPSAYLDAGSTVTDAEPPGAPYVTGVFLSSVTLAWTPSVAAGYRVLASSTDFGAVLPGGSVYFSSAAGGGTSTLAVTGLSANTTYYLKAGAYNWGGKPADAPEVVQATLAQAVVHPGLFGVFATSATANWNPRPASPQTATAEGYVLEASTAASVASPSDFGGVVFSSVSWGIQPATLTITGLDAGATYTFRVGALNWSGAPDYATAGSGITQVTDYVWTGGSGAWGTATNWTPTGVPSGGSRVTIDKSVTVTASGTGIQFYTLTVGDAAGTFAPTLVLSTGVTSGRDLTVYKNATLTQGISAPLAFAGDVSFQTGATLTHSAIGTSPPTAEVNLSVAGTFTLSAGATIAVSGLGYNGGNANQNGTISGAGGGNVGAATQDGGSGGGHGGPGGAVGSEAGGLVNDTVTNPTAPGSGGAGGRRTGTGGAGGGLVIVSAGSMQFDGLIQADGADGTAGQTGRTGRTAGGGGSGGGVNLSADYFVGAGTVSVVGGVGGTDGDGANNPGGGGGGGMVSVAVGFSGDACDLTISTAGGLSGGGSAYNGGDGTFSSTSTVQAPAGFSGVDHDSTTILWTWSLSDHGKSYQVLASTGGAVSPVLGASAVSYLETGLLSNTTFTRFVRVYGCNSSADSSSDALATLAAPPAAAASPILSIGTDRIQAAWIAYPAPQSASAEGYRLEASSTNFGALLPGGVTVSSETPSVYASTLTAVFPPLDANTTYYLRVAAYNWAGELSSYTALGSVSTLARAPTPLASDFLGVFAASATVQWASLPLSPQAASAEGFVLEASSTDFGAAHPGGVTTSSATADVRVSTLSAYSPSLLTNHLYYFRVGSLNWAGAVNFTQLSSTITPFEMIPPDPGAPLYTGVSSGAIVANWLRTGNPLGSLYRLESSADAGFAATASSDTYNLYAATTTLSPSTTYYFRVRASSGTGVSGFTVLAATMTWRLPPAAAGTPFPNAQAHQVSAAWLDGGNPGGIDYVLAFSTDASYPNGDPGNLVLTTAPAGALLSATLTGTAPNTTYYAYAAALNPIGAPSAWLSIGAVLTPAAAPVAAAQTFSTVGQSSFTALWDGDGNPVAITTYTVQVSTASDFNFGVFDTVVFDTVPAATPLAATFTGLNADTTYYFRALAQDLRGRLTAFTSLGATVTLAGAASPSVTGVFLSSVAASWTPVAADSYELRASSTDFGAVLPGGSVYFSSAAGAGTSSLWASGLAANTSWYLRLSAVNHGGAATTVDFGPAATLAAAPARPWIYKVYATSITVNWTPSPSSPQSASAEGYSLEASTAANPASTSDFGGVIYSSVSWGVQPATLTISGLDAGATVTLRVGALNWAGAANYATTGTVVTAVTNFVWTGGNGTWDTATNWTPNGTPSGGSQVLIDRNVTVTANGNAIRFFGLTLGDAAGSFSPTLVVSTTVASGRDLLVYKNATFTQGTTDALAFKGDVTFSPGSTLSHSATGTSPQGAEVNLSVAGTFTLSAGATAAVSGLGFNGGAANGGNGVVAYAGGGTGSSASSAGGAGGGHGGSGGAAGTNGGGATNDSATNPVLVGSGGGGGDGTTGGVGGKGGGAVLVTAGTMQIDGLIQADGAVGGTGPGGATTTGAGGGGAGGSVNLTADYFTGVGTVTALGGSGGTDTDGGNDPGGGGGGGRVSIAISVTGGACDLAISTAGGPSGGGTSSAGGGGSFSSTSTFQAPTGFAGVSPTSTTVLWTWTLATGGKAYQVWSTTGGAMSPLLGPAVSQYDESGLLANTTYARYVRVTGCGNGADSAQASRATLSTPPQTLSPAFPSVLSDRVSATWTPLPAGPPEQSAEGYRLEASSTNFGALTPGGVTIASETATVYASTLTAQFPSLQANTTYFFRVASLNWTGELSSFTALGSTSTLSAAPARLSADYLSVYFTSAAVQWAALPASPPAASASGYVLETSTTDFGALSPGGVTSSSRTASVAASTLTVSGVGADTTYYMRVGSLNQDGAPNWTALTPLNISVTPSAVLLDLGTLDPFVSRSTVSVSSFVFTNTGSLPVTLSLSASTATAGSPWSLGAAPGNETALLQGLWNAGQPLASSFSTPIVVSTTTSGSGPGGNYAGDQDGTQIPPGQSRTLWIRFTMPDTTVDASPQSFQLIVAPTFP
jgi:phosphodiesterase/alkaline phosphatase D-like protein